MFTDNKDFYPTPENLINKMLCDIDFKMIHSILEPSAGKGNIVEAIKKKEKFYSSTYNKVNYDIDCIESDQNLQSILKGKNFRVVYNFSFCFNASIILPLPADGSKMLCIILKSISQNILFIRFCGVG